MFFLTANSTPETQESQSREWVEARLKSGRCWSFVVELLPADGAADGQDSTSNHSPPMTKKFIGMCGAHRIPEMGYMFDPSVWGQGYATEAVKGFLEAYWEAFPEGFPGLEGEEKDYLTAVTDKTNSGSVKVLEKNGFEYWKEQEQMDDSTGEKVMIDVRRVWRPGNG